MENGSINQEQNVFLQVEMVGSGTYEWDLNPKFVFIKTVWNLTFPIISMF